jgi:hypothetical protein
MVNSYKLIDDLDFLDNSNLDKLIELYPSLQKAQEQLFSRMHLRINWFANAMQKSVEDLPLVSVESYYDYNDVVRAEFTVANNTEEGRLQLVIAECRRGTVRNTFWDKYKPLISHGTDLEIYQHMYQDAFLASTERRLLFQGKGELQRLVLHVELPLEKFQVIQALGMKQPPVIIQIDGSESFFAKALLKAKPNDVAYLVENRVPYVIVEDVVEYTIGKLESELLKGFSEVNQDCNGVLVWGRPIDE